MDIRVEPFGSAIAQALITELQADLAVRYGGPDETPIAAEEFTTPRGAFFVAVKDGEPVGCAGLRLLDDGAGEIKRMYVKRGFRGNGIGRALLRAVEQAAVEMACPSVRLETGTGQPEAMRLYETSGYQPIAPYGHYRCSTESRCYEKSLVTSAPDTAAVCPPAGWESYSARRPPR